MAFAAQIEMRRNNTFVVKLEGRLDTDTYPELQAKLKPILVDTTRALILDLSRLEYISSMGLSAIFQARKVLAKNRGQFLVTKVQPQVKKVFEIVKALPAESVFASIEEADEYLDAIQRQELAKQR